ncbi:hypothetical protein [Lyngbya sp. CCY1209]|uniref:hypothetical protein n=1 Tax=Lyngbya sp. CCY1209 TaxID=2886103 RepID=UPI002D20DCA4|nr:hypothetical protein [Lyngbya sp. CCY1209]MEB3882450.1 hypothetical protein [Lyngbya sp. CCY1209]
MELEDPPESDDAMAVASRQLKDFFEGEVLPLTDEEPDEIEADSAVKFEDPPESDFEEDIKEENIPF